MIREEAKLAKKLIEAPEMRPTRDGYGLPSKLYKVKLGERSSL